MPKKNAKKFFKNFWGVCSRGGGSAPRGGGLLQMGLLLWGVYSGGVSLLLGGVWSSGVCSCGVSDLGGVGIPACTEADPPLVDKSQMPVKTLPWPNFVAAGKYVHVFIGNFDHHQVREL